MATTGNLDLLAGTLSGSEQPSVAIVKTNDNPSARAGANITL
jgi:hypothetical protein